MATSDDNRWKAILGMSSDHAGIDQELRRLQAELYRVLARIDDPRAVAAYLKFLRGCSNDWLASYSEMQGQK